MTEVVLDLKVLRSIHLIDAERWTGFPTKAYWGEWDHHNETSRSFQSIVDGLQEENWTRFIEPGSTLIDIGGHSGDTAIPMALFGYDKKNKKGPKVIVVEPNPSVLGVLRANLAFNFHLADFILAPYAITSVDVDEIELSDHNNANCNGGIVSDPSYSQYLVSTLESVSVNRYKARGVSLTSLLAESGVTDASSVSFIKTDCEGHDKEILRGSSEFLRQVKPTLFIEWFAWFGRDDDGDLFSIVNDLGYHLFDPKTLEPASVHVKIPDLLCVHSSRLDQYSLSSK